MGIWLLILYDLITSAFSLYSSWQLHASDLYGHLSFQFVLKLATACPWSVLEEVYFSCTNLYEVCPKFLPTVYKLQHRDKSVMSLDIIIPLCKPITNSTNTRKTQHSTSSSSRRWTSINGWKFWPSQRPLSISLDPGRSLSSF